MRKDFENRRGLLDHLEQPVVLDHDERVDAVAKVQRPDLGLLGSTAALEGERLRDDSHRQRLQLAPELGDDRRRTGSGAATLAGGDEDHVGALERLLQLVATLLRRCVADLGVRPRAETPRRLRADVDLDVGVGVEECLRIVFTAMNSTPVRPDSTMRLTAFVPPPPTPTTLITAR